MFQLGHILLQLLQSLQHLAEYGLQLIDAYLFAHVLLFTFLFVVFGVYPFWDMKIIPFRWQVVGIVTTSPFRVRNMG